jgi:hypothetical protein
LGCYRAPSPKPVFISTIAKPKCVAHLSDAPAIGFRWPNHFPPPSH